MPTSRRDLLKFATLAAAAGAFPALASPTVARAERPLRILILGGTGFTGPFQVAYALARGHSVTLFNRGKRPTPEWPGEVEQLHGDRNTGDLSALDGREWDVCIDNPTTLPFWVRDAGEALRGRVGHYIFISTISVYADGSRPGIDEDAPLAAYTGADPLAETMESFRADMAGLYGPLKAASEAEARRQFGEAVTVVRPGYIVGPRDETGRFTYWPLRVAEGGEVLVPGDGRDPVQFIDGRDLGEWVIRLAETRTFGTFNAVGPARRMDTDPFLAGIKEATGSDARFTHVPADFLAAREVRFGADLPIWFPQDHEYGGYGQVDNSRAIAAGLVFRPLSTTVTDLLEWHRALPAERQAGQRAGMSREREAELLREWHAQGEAGTG
ncbi:NAD-dependent epimerase/dehydratase family protein [Luteimonas yindakuii]|uniref:NAD-dependent epimerase/dehydratase family protein n=1 Tax=Luteimonas yindakuii TaxID=2565782 RepID=A0A4Z1RJP7_9GAMM|nr:NAD-dependent epimerase/dehydratase family protein [Luteimonas yindakuii]TKS53861.1 NAD-dependent epimerase/dehydratase family protein [Luteimonas yindakuii]